jgi:hypothetical protein
MESLHLSESRIVAPWHGGAVAIVAAALALTALLLVVSRHGPIHAMSLTTSAASEAKLPTVSVTSTALPFDVSSRMLPDELPPPAEASDSNGPKP